MATAFGRRGVRAEAVADTVANDIKAYLASPVAVGPHLADQLLLPLALAGGGSFTSTAPTPHTTTNAATIAKFLDIDIKIDPIDDAGHCRVTVGEIPNPL